MIGDDGRENAESVLDDTCVITRATGGEWTPGGGLPSGTATVYAGPCSLLAPRDRRQSDAGGDERLRTTLTLLLPVGEYAPQAADTVAIASCAETYYVVEDEERSHRVLRRVQVATSLDAEGVPR